MRRIVGAALAICIVLAVGAGLIFEWQQIAPRLAEATPGTGISAKTTAAIANTSPAQSAAVQKESAQIQSLLQNFAQQYPGQVSAVAIDLDNGAQGSANADTQMVSASLYKLFVAYGIYQKIDDGSLTLATNVGAMHESVGACMGAMIEVSDNDCGKALGDIVGWQTLDTKLKTLGLMATKLNNYTSGGNVNGDKTTTAADVATFMRQLYNGTLLSKNSTAAFIALLKKDKLNDWLPSGLPADTVIAHKTGALYNLVHDAGFVYVPNGTYLVVVMTKGWNNPSVQAPGVFSAISRQLWNYFNS